MTPPVGPSWSRLTYSGPVLLFLALSGGMWLAALASWELGSQELATILTGLGAAAPILLMVAHVHSRPALWVLRVHADADAVEIAVRRAVADRKAIAVGPVPEREGLFRRCDAVMRIENPACLIGWRATTARRHSEETTMSSVVLQGNPRETTALDALRDAIAAAFAASNPRVP